MINLSILAVFIPTFFFVSITPGMCMTLAMTMGMTIGLRRTFLMMIGELLGVGLVALLSVVGVATIMLQYPAVFLLFKYLGGAYLFYLGIQLWLSRGKMAVTEERLDGNNATAMELATQGFVTAVANPKGWAFFVALLPPFISDDLPMAPQISILLAMILVIEFCCLVIYASGGRTMSKFLQKSGNLQLMNRIAGTLMMVVGIWLAFG
ncbi:LysE family translocator [Motiliproteus sp. MSK22-1]|uniref:LysE family translocator n=1 Tax=Motiliproteus sp. MSK22-1 TaxID=1897630 RepID=UPI0018E9642D|nr:LysE family translocator [Motiliproteus sp. MSK22-1]